MATRNIDLEREKVDQFIGEKGRKPESSDDWSIVHRMTYGGDVPEELQTVQKETIGIGGQTPPPTSEYGTDTTRLGGLEQRLDTAQEKQAGITGVNTFSDVMQRALQAKIGASDTKLGKSELFEKAGLTGFASLGQSLGQKSQEIKNERVALQNLVTSMSGMYKDMANNTLIEMDMAAKLYEQEADRVSAVDMMMQKSKLDLEYLTKQHELQRQLKAYEHSLRSSSTPKKGEDFEGDKNELTEELIALRDAGKLSDSTWSQGINQLMADYNIEGQESYEELEGDIQDLMRGAEPLIADESGDLAGSEYETPGGKTGEFIGKLGTEQAFGLKPVARGLEKTGEFITDVIAGATGTENPFKKPPYNR